MYTVVSPAIIPVFDALFLFGLNDLAKAFSPVLNRSGGNKHSYLTINIRTKHSSIYLFSMMSVVC